jgi:hypothetical protein
VLGHRVEDAARARSDCSHVEPARGTTLSVPCRSSAELFRVVPVPAHRAWPMWPSIRAGGVCLDTSD